MLIENVMYFALGLLAAGLVALIIMPAVWKRAVRLTKRRIEAATPITMAEFRADKDQLRAEFALSTRRLEMSIEQLRQRLAEQLTEIDHKRTELVTLKAERAQHQGIVDELEARQTELQARVAELERDDADLAERLRTHERELTARTEELMALRGGQSSDDEPTESDSLVTAEAHIAHAETQLDAILAETDPTSQKSAGAVQQLLADKLGLDDELEALRAKVDGVESTIMADWGSERIEDADLRARLNEIATSVSRLVNSVDREKPAAAEESLFDRVQRFAGDTQSTMPLPKAPSSGKRKSRVAARISAMREIQRR